VTKIPPPLLGYNNNVRYKGRTFHIQTEDSGTKYARIVTHLFVDGGRIVKSIRTQYTEFLRSADMAETVRRMMKEQHKGMFLSLRAGEFDDAISRIVGEADATMTPVPPSLDPNSERSNALASMPFASSEVPTSVTSSLFGPSEAPTSPLGSSLTSDFAGSELRAMRAPAIQEELGAGPSDTLASGLARAPGQAESTHASGTPSNELSSRPASQQWKTKSSRPPSGQRHRVVDDPTPVEYLPATAPHPANVTTAQVRPSERPPRMPPSRPMTVPADLDPRSPSIFGDSGEARQSLDEVILSFLEEEED